MVILMRSMATTLALSVANCLLVLAALYRILLLALSSTVPRLIDSSAAALSED